MKVESFKCDVCGTQKGEINHWLLVLPQPANVRVSFGTVTFYPWLPDIADSGHHAHLCGEECAGKFLSQTIASWREVPTSEVPA